MFSKLQNKINSSEKAGGIEIVFSADGSVCYNLCIAERKKNEIIPVLSQADIKSIEELKSLIPSDIPIGIAISGKGVVLKKISKEAYKKLSGFSELIPDVKEADVVGDKVLTDEHAFFTIIRKSLILQYLTLFDKSEISVVNVRSGPAYFNSIAGAISTDIVNSDIYEFHLENHNILSISSAKNKMIHQVKIGDIQFESNILISFASALSLILNIESDSTFSEIKLRAEEWKERKLFRKISRGGLIIVSCLVFLNLFLFFYWSDVNKNLSAQNKNELVKVKELEILENKYNEKEAFVKKAGWMQHSRMSMFMDGIASTVPVSVSLTELTVNPLDEGESRLQKKILFSVGKVIVSGTCKDPVVLNPWIKTLKTFAWVESVTNRKYHFDGKNQIGRFEIELIVKNEF